MTKPASNASTAKPGVSAMTAALMAGNPAAARAWMDIMAESARFLSDRLQEDLETQKAMLRCKNPADLVQLQSAFFRKALEQYTAEAQKLFEIMRDAADKTMKDARSGHSRGYDDVPL